MKATLLSAAWFVALIVAGRADSGTVIRSLPFEIKAGGHYCLEENLSVTGGAEGIRISASDVVLDLAGFTLSTASISGNAAAGVYITATKNVVVRNGTIRGFATGVIVQGNSATELYSAHVLENLRILEARNEGVYVESGSGCTAVHRCDVLGIGPASIASAYAIDLRCAFGVVSDCRVQSSDVGISILGPHCTVSGNSVVAGVTGITFGTGGSGTRMNNSVLGAKTPYEGGTDGGGNQ